MRRRKMLALVAACALGAPWALGTSRAGTGAPAEGSAAARPAGAPSVLVFAAASLTDALDAVARAFTASTATSLSGSAPVQVRTSYAASSVLARQIEAGAPAQVYLSADTDWMDYLDQRHLLKPGSRHDLLSNQLVLIAPLDSPVRVTLRHGVDFDGVLKGGRLATGDPDSVPVGRYARAALTWLGVWDRVSPRLVRAENVRAALEYVARGEAPLGIVYRTDALAEKRVRVVEVFPEASHPPIVYPVALTLRASPDAARFEAFLAGDTARQIFERYGFEVARRPATAP